MKCHKTGNMEQNLFLTRLLVKKLETFSGRSCVLWFVLPTSCSTCYLSCLYMWKTATSLSFRLSAQLDFPLFPQWKTAHFSLKKTERRVWLVLWLCPNMSSSGHSPVYLPWVCFSPDDDNYTHETLTVNHPVTVSDTNVFPPSHGEALWAPVLCCLRSLCSSAQCVSLCIKALMRGCIGFLKKLWVL